MLFRKCLILIVGVCLTVLFTLADACTGIRLTAQDHSVIYARTLEFAQNIKSKLIVIPRDYNYTGTTPSGNDGIHWKTKFAVVGMNAFNYPITIDGMNEKGLAVGLFYFPGYAKYQSSTPADKSNELAPWQLGTYLLSQFSSVQEVRQALQKVKVVPVVFKQFGIVLPVHYIVTDASGKSIVIEYQNRKLHVYDNPIGVFTNSPSFPWMMTNLSNYTNLSAINVPPVHISGIKITSFGQGSGLHGLPGNFTPPARFIRATVFTQAAPAVATGHDAVLQAFHLLNQFDLPVGSIRSVENSTVEFDRTLWTSAADLQGKRYYFKTFSNQDIRMVDFAKLKLNKKQITWMYIDSKQPIQDVSAKLQPGSIVEGEQPNAMKK